jgi:hypothetical protein
MSEYITAEGGKTFKLGWLYLSQLTDDGRVYRRVRRRELKRVILSGQPRELLGQYVRFAYSNVIEERLFGLPVTGWGKFGWNAYFYEGDFLVGCMRFSGLNKAALLAWAVK